MLLSPPIRSPLKNIIHWALRWPNVQANKPAAVLSSASGFGGEEDISIIIKKLWVFIDLRFISIQKQELALSAFQPPLINSMQKETWSMKQQDKLKQILASSLTFTMRLHHFKVRMWRQFLYETDRVMKIMPIIVIRNSVSLLLTKVSISH